MFGASLALALAAEAQTKQGAGPSRRRPVSAAELIARRQAQAKWAKTDGDLVRSGFYDSEKRVKRGRRARSGPPDTLPVFGPKPAGGANRQAFFGKATQHHFFQPRTAQKLDPALRRARRDSFYGTATRDGFVARPSRVDFYGTTRRDEIYTQHAPQQTSRPPAGTSESRKPAERTRVSDRSNAARRRYDR